MPDDTLRVTLSSSDELGSSGVGPVLSESFENLGLQILFLKNFYIYYLQNWMNLEPIIQSEVSQKEKHQYSILTHIYGI